MEMCLDKLIDLHLHDCKLQCKKKYEVMEKW